MTTNSTVVVAKLTSVTWKGEMVSVLHNLNLVNLTGEKGDFFVREARKLSPTPIYPINSQREESPELDWLPGCGGFRISADKAEQVAQLLEYIDMM